LLMLSLTRLENLVYEPWRLLERDWRVVYDRRKSNPGITRAHSCARFGD